MYAFGIGTDTAHHNIQEVKHVGEKKMNNNLTYA
jgi:hypothetical protein